MNKKLEVNNLRISFRTNNGTVKAVRDISFSLNKGETLAIVGESGSGKSVTARAVMGILAGNAIVEGGEIFYEGQDLMKISEEDFHEIRGNRIAMIFQDPLSSLNPITRIGKQLTEAMILTNRTNRRKSKAEFRSKIRLLSHNMSAALGDSMKGEIQEDISVLKKFTLECSKLEKKYNTAREAAETSVSDIDAALIDIILGKPSVISKKIKDIISVSEKSYHEFLVNQEISSVPGTIKSLKAANLKYAKSGQKEDVKALLASLRDGLKDALDAERPNFFRIGYYITYCPAPVVDAADVPALNERALQYLDSNFMSRFLKNAAAGIEHSAKSSIERKKQALPLLDESLTVFNSGKFSPAYCTHIKRVLIPAVEKCIDRLSIHKESLEYTFRSSIVAACDTYERGLRLTRKKHLSKKAKVLAANVDMPLYESNIKLILRRVRDAFAAQTENVSEIDFLERAVAMTDHLKEQNSIMVTHVTKRTARARAISLMEEVGIPEAHKRYYQYPFQFSGGMRQRIVIAIALSANPDILICDEPTTALDVTIQAQILDLINKLKRERQLTVIFITHDLGVVANISDRIAVMYAGKIVEYGTTHEVFYSPAHPYTWALLASMPDLDSKDKLESIPGTPPNMIFPPKGDAFAVRSKYAMAIDFEEEPPMFNISPTHGAATWLLHPDAPKVEPPKLVTERINRMSQWKEGDTNG